MTFTVTMQSTKLMVFLFLSICVNNLSYSQEPFLGPYRAVLRQLEQCKDSGTRQIYTSSTRISKVSRDKYVYSTNITTEVEVNDDITVESDIAIFGNGGWRPHYMQFEFTQFCSFLKRAIPGLYKAATTALRTDFPLPPVLSRLILQFTAEAIDNELMATGYEGTYEIKEFDIESFRMPTVPKLIYGKYRIDLFGKINGTLIGCIRYYIDIIPDMSKKSQKNKKNNS